MRPGCECGAGAAMRWSCVHVCSGSGWQGPPLRACRPTRCPARPVGGQAPQARHRPALTTSACCAWLCSGKLWDECTGGQRVSAATGSAPKVSSRRGSLWGPHCPSSTCKPMPRTASSPALRITLHAGCHDCCPLGHRRPPPCVRQEHGSSAAWCVKRRAVR